MAASLSLPSPPPPQLLWDDGRGGRKAWGCGTLASGCGVPPGEAGVRAELGRGSGVTNQGHPSLQPPEPGRAAAPSSAPLAWPVMGKVAQGTAGPSSPASLLDSSSRATSEGLVPQGSPEGLQARRHFAAAFVPRFPFLGRCSSSLTPLVFSGWGSFGKRAVAFNDTPVDGKRLELRAPSWLPYSRCRLIIEESAASKLIHPKSRLKYELRLPLQLPPLRYGVNLPPERSPCCLPGWLWELPFPCPPVPLLGHLCCSTNAQVVDQNRQKTSDLSPRGSRSLPSPARPAPASARAAGRWRQPGPARGVRRGQPGAISSSSKPCTGSLARRAWGEEAFAAWAGRFQQKLEAHSQISFAEAVR